MIMEVAAAAVTYCAARPGASHVAADGVAAARDAVALPLVGMLLVQCSGTGAARMEVAGTSSNGGER